MAKQKPTPKKKRYDGTCFTCNKKIESNEPIKHEHAMVINDHAKLRSYYKKETK